MEHFQDFLNVLSSSLRKISGSDELFPMSKWQFSEVGIKFVVQIAQLWLGFDIDASPMSHCVSELQ